MDPRTEYPMNGTTTAATISVVIRRVIHAIL
jgi:hypothetical protein